MKDSIVIGGIINGKESTLSESDTVVWRDFLDGKYKFSEITIQHPECFLNDTEPDPKKLRGLLSSCCDGVKILIAKIQSSSNPASILAGAILKTKSSLGMTITQSHIQLETTKQQPSHYTNLLIQKLNETSFLSNFCDSLIKLNEYKREFYRASLKILNKDLELSKAKLQKLKELGIETKDKSFSIEMIANSITVVGLILERISESVRHISPDRMKVRLECIINHPKFGLGCLVGRENLKERIVRSIIAFSNNYKSFIGVFHNFCLMGCSGVGKTHAARVISHAFSSCGMLATDSITITTRADFIAGFVGQTALKTREVLFNSLEGILFIDEAYELAPRSDKDYGHESLTEVVNFLDKYIGMCVVIVAGYRKQMESKFFASNEGLSRRFPWKITLGKYTNGELHGIFRGILVDKDLESGDIETICGMVEGFMEGYPRAFNHQGGDVILLADRIVEELYFNYGGGLGEIVEKGIDDFLKMKKIKRC